MNMNQEIKPKKPSETLRELLVGESAFFPTEKEESAKVTAYRIKRREKKIFKSKIVEDGIFITRIS